MALSLTPAQPQPSTKVAGMLLEEREGLLGRRWCLLRKRNITHQLGQ